jgi:hypothetical protein
MVHDEHLEPPIRQADQPKHDETWNCVCLFV